MGRPSGKDRYEVGRIRQHAKDAKALQRKLETKKKEIDRQKAFARKEVQRKLKEIEKIRRDLDKLVRDIKDGEYADKEAVATFKAVQKLTKVAQDWMKNPEGPAGPEAVALALALLVTAVGKLVKRAVSEGK